MTNKGKSSNQVYKHCLQEFVTCKQNNFQIVMDTVTTKFLQSPTNITLLVSGYIRQHIVYTTDISSVVIQFIANYQVILNVQRVQKSKSLWYQRMIIFPNLTDYSVCIKMKHHRMIMKKKTRHTQAAKKDDLSAVNNYRARMQLGLIGLKNNASLIKKFFGIFEQLEITDNQHLAFDDIITIFKEKYGFFENDIQLLYLTYEEYKDYTFGIYFGSSDNENSLIDITNKNNPYNIDQNKLTQLTMKIEKCSDTSRNNQNKKQVFFMDGKKNIIGESYQQIRNEQFVNGKALLPTRYVYFLTFACDGNGVRYKIKFFL